MTSKRLIVLYVAIAVIAIALITFSAPNPSRLSTDASVSSQDTGPQSVAPALADTVPSRSSEPPSWKGVTVHPYQLVKNPFAYKGQLISLDLGSRPVLYNGSVIQYGNAVNPVLGIRLGLMALKLDRMIAEDEALYDVMGGEAGENFAISLGKILIVIPPEITELDLARTWLVETKGLQRGTNALGAPQSIPLILFRKYLDASDVSEEQRLLRQRYHE